VDVGIECLRTNKGSIKQWVAPESTRAENEVVLCTRGSMRQLGSDRGGGRRAPKRANVLEGKDVHRVGSSILVGTSTSRAPTLPLREQQAQRRELKVEEVEGVTCSH
jgi:hypothetical protein